jgi:ribosomal protein S18 acetylase RimI-like enzyme
LGTIVRDAGAGDAEFLAQVSLLASRAHVGWGMYDVVLGLPDDELLRYLEQLTATRAEFFHHFRRRLVGEVDGEAAGAIAGFVNDEASRNAFVPALLEVFGGDGLESIAERRAPWLTCAIDPPEGAWVIELVATLPAFRGKGLSAALLDASLERGRAAGCREAVITYEIGNEPAAAAYRKAGFRFVGERRDPAFERTFRVPGLVQVRRLL